MVLISGGISSLPVVKISNDSKFATEYRVPTLNGYAGAIRSDFDVSADGTVYSLLQRVDAMDSKAPPSSFIAKSKDDGSP